MGGSATFTNTNIYDNIATRGAGVYADFDNEPRPIVRTNPSTPYDMGVDEFSAPRLGINDGGCAYGTLTQAGAAAEDGDTLQAATDTFHEAVDINGKDLTIVGAYESDCTTPGAGPTILDASYHSGSAGVCDILRLSTPSRPAPPHQGRKFRAAMGRYRPLFRIVRVA